MLLLLSLGAHTRVYNAEKAIKRIGDAIHVDARRRRKGAHNVD
jgi:hypothetical protein